MKHLLTILLLFSAGILTAEAQSVKTISGAQQINPEKQQSYYWQRIPLENNIIPEIKLTHIKTKGVSQILSDSIEVSNGFTPDIFIATERKQKYASLKIPLYCKQNNQVTQLVGYEISVTYPDKAYEETAQKPTGVSHSVLATGNWYKMAVTKRGLYKIDYSFLQSMGINPTQVNPKNIRVYGNGGTILPEGVSDDQPDDLIQNAIYVHASGNTFGANDYVLFYANGPVLWEKDSIRSRFKHTNNPYADKSYYFLNFDSGSGLRIAEENANGNASHTYTDFNDYAVYDHDSINIGKIGRQWWSNEMNSQTGAPSSTSLSMNLGGVKDSVYASIHVANVNIATGNTLTMKINGQTVSTTSLQNSPSGIYFYDATNTFYFQPGSPNLNIQFKYNPNGSGSAYLDYIELNYKRNLSFSGKELAFRNWASAALNAGELAGYTISNAPSGIKIWDITHPLKPIALKGTLSGNSYHFTREGGSLHEFIAFNGTQFPSPQYIGTVANQDLHGLSQTDLLIITNNDLKPSADAFAAFHRQRDGINVTVATLGKIYNEFSSGGQDIGGIRNFIKMFYDRAQGEQDMLKNVLLLGAASYDYKDRIAHNTNIVPTYETTLSSTEGNAFSTDDYYTILDPGETILSTNNLLDIGIGRIPATTNEEAQDALNKIKAYVSPASFGPWKNVVSFVADAHDDGNFGSMDHSNDCEQISNFFYEKDRIYNLYKIYSDAYNDIPEAGGLRFPDVNRAINDRAFNGTFLMSYSGHGNFERWSHYAIFTADDYDDWTNINKLPIIFTGTCDFGRFDKPEEKYAGVKLMMNPKGGCIAIITTTQQVVQGGNRELGINYMLQQFGERDSSGRFYTLGDGLRHAKNASSNGGGYNKVRYVLLGDPALHPPIPQLDVNTDSLLMNKNGQWVKSDTLKALGNYALAGSIKDDHGQLQSDFNGSVYVTIFDKPTTIQTVYPLATTPSFKVQNNIIAKVRAEVVNGHFNAEFIVPKDINYDLGLGKISYYANSDTKDANGLDTMIYIGGYNQIAPADDQPPVVKAYIDNEKFRDGGATGPNPMLYVKLSDDHGINVSGGSVGHDLVAILDDDIQNPMVMNNYYQTEESDFRNGYVYFPLYNLPEGKHTITVKAWDTYNNSGTGSVSFEVHNKDKGFISEIYNYPNPVTDITHFVFQHNQAGEEMKVTLQVFNTSGALQWTYQKELTPEGNRTEITWDGTGLNGQPLAKGVYFYRLHIKTQKGAEATAYQKLILLKP